MKLNLSGNIRPFSEVNGTNKNLSHYDKWDNSITFVQYQSGAMGLNLQKADTIIYFSLPLSSELFEQSKKRIHRIGQQHKCTYYIFMCENSVEQKIYNTLQERKDYTDKLFIYSCVKILWSRKFIIRSRSAKTTPINYLKRILCKC